MIDVFGPELESLTHSREISTQDQTTRLRVSGSVLTARPSSDHLDLVGSIAFSSFQPALGSTSVEQGELAVASL